MEDRRKARHLISRGVFGWGLLLASLYLIQHLFVEPRREPYFHPVVETLVILAGCAALGAVISLVTWHLKTKRADDD